MPGIVGVISRESNRRFEAEVAKMLAVMRHDLSYIQGDFAQPELGIYCGWTAHAHSFAAEQVFESDEGNLALVLSGECFFDSETQPILRRRGYDVKPDHGSWVLHLYAELGDRFLEHLNGLFSGLLVDKRRNRALLFNDRYGLERIYWHETKEAFYFGSEAKALLQVIPALREFDWDGINQFLTLGCNLGEQTLFRGVQLAPGGSLWEFASGSYKRTKYFEVGKWESQSTLSPEHFDCEFEQTFSRILPRYFQGKSKTGVSLTAGLDSRMIMACLPSVAETPVAYTFSGTRSRTLDDRLAARVAEACHIHHQLLRIKPDFFANFRAHAEKTVYVTDGNFGILGAHEIYLSSQARNLAPVRVTGNFGSEVLRGISTFKGVGLASRLLNPEIIATSASTTGIPGRLAHPVTFAAFSEIPYNLFGSLAASRSEIVFRTPYLDNELVALAYRIPILLRLSPEPSMRLIHRRKPALARIPTDMGLSATGNGLLSTLRNAFAKATFKLDYFNNEGLPPWLSILNPLLIGLHRAGLLGLHKYLHYRSWFAEELSSYAREALQDVVNRRSALWNIVTVKEIMRDQEKGLRNRTAEINAILTLDAVERLLLHSLPRYSSIDQAVLSMSSIAG